MKTMITNSNGNCANVLIDTCIWSLVLRHRQPLLESHLIQEFSFLTQQERVVMLGAIRQELLSGIREPQRFEWLRQKLRTFADFPVDTEDYERAAEFSNLCRAKGIQGSPTDFLLCAIAGRHQFTIFTTDKDFEYFRRYIDFQLYTPLRVATESG